MSGLHLALFLCVNHCARACCLGNLMCLWKSIYRGELYVNFANRLILHALSSILTNHAAACEGIITGLE